MEALVAVGLASNILQFVDFSTKLVIKAAEARKSASGVPKDWEDALAAGEQLQQTLNRHKLSAGNHSLATLAVECKATCDELQKVFRRVQGKQGSSGLRVSLRSLTQKSKLDSLQSRIDIHRTQILTLLMAMLSDQHDATHQSQSTIVQLVQSLTTSNADAHKRLSEDLAITKDKLTKLIGTNGAIEDICLSLSQMTTATMTADRYGEILTWLWYPELGGREASVVDAHKGTYQWILQEQPRSSEIGMESPRTIASRSFRSWLSNGEGVFYVSGKAGSGKSTLMKTLAHHGRTQELLDEWSQAAQKKLLFVRYFFWHPGTPLQRSIEGLYRGLLWEILRDCPSLMSTVFPDIATQRQTGAQPRELAMQPSLSILKGALQRLVSDTELLHKYRLCMFIDGLDEYEGEYWELSAQLKSWCNSDGVKICVSSRPHEEFLRLFAAPNKWLKLHDLTRDDIRHVVQETFDDDERIATSHRTPKEHKKLIELIIHRSDGVFLWVRLVLQRLLTGIIRGCTAAQLQARLDGVPDGLDAMFRYMLDSVDRVDKAAVARDLNLATMLIQKGAISGIFALADELSENPGLSASILEGTYVFTIINGKGECTDECREISRRVVGRCQGLLVTEPTGDPDGFPFCHIIQPMHRTLADFLCESWSIAQLEAMQGSVILDNFRLTALWCLSYWHRGGFQMEWERERNLYSKGTMQDQWFYCDCEHCQPGSLRPGCDFRALHCLAVECKNAGHGPLTTEIDTWVTMQKHHAMACKKGWVLTYARLPFEYDMAEYRLRDGFYVPFAAADIEAATLWHAVEGALYLEGNSSRAALDHVQRSCHRNPELLTHLRYDLLLSAACNEAHLGTFLREESVTVFLLAEQRVGRYPLVSLGGVVLQDDDKGDTVYRPDTKCLFDAPAWTTWCLFLFAQSILIRGRVYESKDGVRRIVDEFLEAGADPSVCFIGYTLKKRDHFDTSYGGCGKLQGPYYMHLAAMMTLWDLEPSATAVALFEEAMQSAQECRFELFDASKSVESEYFQVVKVAPFRQLGQVSLDDVELFKNDLIDAWLGEGRKRIKIRG